MSKSDGSCEGLCSPSRTGPPMFETWLSPYLYIGKASKLLWRVKVFVFVTDSFQSSVVGRQSMVVVILVLYLVCIFIYRNLETSSV